MGWKKVVNDLLGRSGYLITRASSSPWDPSRPWGKWLKSRDIRTVIDVGANIGGFSRAMRNLFPSATIIAFEPIQDCFKSLQRVASKIPPMECYPFALGRLDGSAPMFRHTFAPSSSLLPIVGRTIEAFPYTRSSKEERVEVRQMDGLLRDRNLPGPLLLKADVQGYELEVLAGGPLLLSSAAVVILETSFVELYSGQPLFDEVYSYMRERGLRFVGNATQLEDPNTGETLQSDAVFVRDHE